MTAPVSDLLSAAGLLLGVTSVLYGLWFPEISAAIDRPVKEHAADRDSDYKHCRRVYFGRALPLAIAALLFSLIFVPNALEIVLDAARRLRLNPAAAIRSYDAVRACLVVVSLALIMLAAYVAVAALRLRTRCALQDPKRSAGSI